jgi:integrase
VSGHGPSLKKEAEMASIRKRKTNKGTKYTVLYDFTDKDGKRRQKSAGTFDRKSDAELSLSDIESKKRKNDFVVPSDETTGEFIARWLPIRAASKRWEASYLETATYLLKNHVVPEIGNMLLRHVTSMHIEVMFARLQRKRHIVHGKRKTESDIPFLSQSTLASIYTLVKCFFDAAVLWKVIDENPVKIEKPEADEHESAFWESDMIRLALENMSDGCLRLMVHIASAHTCRNGEICGLTWDTINFEKGTLLINKTLQRVKKKAFEQLPPKEVFRIFPNKVKNSETVLILKTPKTKKSVRVLYLTSPILDALRMRKERIEKDKTDIGEDYRDFDLVFCHEDGTPIEPNLLLTRFHKWQERHSDLGLPAIVFHGLRHSSTTLLMSISSSDAKTVQSVTGHHSAKFVFDEYNHAVPSKQKELVRKLENVLYGDEKKAENISAESLLSAIKENPSLAQEVLSALFAACPPHAHD